jgi:hypothetical protein
MYRVSKGWKVKGPDGRVYKPGQEPTLAKNEIKRLLALGAIYEVVSRQVEDDIESEAENEGELPPVENDADEDGDAEVTANADEVPAFGGDISDPQDEPDDGSDEEKPKKGRSGRSK